MRLCIATPSRTGMVHVPFAASLIDTMQALAVGGIAADWRVLSQSSFIQCARNRLAHEFMQADYTDLLFIDDDMGWDVEGILRMLTADVDVVGAICPKRKDPIEWNVNLLSQPDGQRIEQEGLLEAAYVGTALLRIRRAALALMPDGLYFNAGYEVGGFIGEDAWFCREYRKHGGRVWADPRVRVSHTGPKSWVGAYNAQENA